jgi:hypothetical protein
LVIKKQNLYEECYYELNFEFLNTVKSNLSFLIPYYILVGIIKCYVPSLGSLLAAQWVENDRKLVETNTENLN